MHVDKCDNFCGGSKCKSRFDISLQVDVDSQLVTRLTHFYDFKVNPFGKSGTCKSCCLDKGFYGGGDCGDFLYRHCRCTLNPAGGFGFQPGQPAPPNFG